MKEKVNMADIAARLNVSKVTVSKALNDKEGVGEVLRARIKTMAQEMGYRINHAARSLKTQKSYNIGLLIPDRFIGSQVSYYFHVSGEMFKAFGRLGYSGIMEILTAENESNIVLPRIYLEGKVDGIIVLGQLEEPYLRALEAMDTPMIYLDFYLNHSTIDSVTVDNFYASYELTVMLIEQGHKHIGFVGNIYSTSSIQDRFLGYYKGLLESHLSLDEQTVIKDRDGLGELIPLILPEKMPTAFVVNSDQIALYLLRTLKESGYRVPEDVSVVSFDNTIYSTLANPEITTVDNNVQDLVETAAKIIVKKIENPKKVYGRVMIKGDIMNRASHGAPRQ